MIAHAQYARTSEDAANALGGDVAAVIKTLVLETYHGFAVAIIAGDERLVFKAIARYLWMQRGSSDKSGTRKEVLGL